MSRRHHSASPRQCWKEKGFFSSLMGSKSPKSFKVHPALSTHTVVLDLHNPSKQIFMFAVGLGPLLQMLQSSLALHVTRILAEGCRLAHHLLRLFCLNADA